MPDWTDHDTQGLGRCSRLVWEWWVSKRPIDWSAQRHRKRPLVNVHAYEAAPLAQYAADVSKWINE